MSRLPSASVLARQAAKDADRSAAIAARLEQLVALAPDAAEADLKYLARACGTNPTFGTILRVLGAK